MMTDKALFMELLIELSKGLPGTLQFLMAAATQSPELFVKIKNSGLVGTELYTLWADISEYDLDKVDQLLDHCPPDLLLAACSREDRSGKEMVSEFLQPKTDL